MIRYRISDWVALALQGGGNARQKTKTGSDATGAPARTGACWAGRSKMTKKMQKPV